jgi:hypothetical protein
MRHTRGLLALGALAVPLAQPARASACENEVRMQLTPVQEVAAAV